MSGTESVIQEIKKVFDTQRLAVLSTVDAGSAPYCSLVGFSASGDLKQVFFATSKNTTKFANLKRNPAVSMLVDSRANAASDFSDAVAITLTGNAEEVGATDIENALKKFCEKLPELEKFTSEESCSLISVKVDKYLFVGNFQEVQEIRMT